jgi:hypothetical protein
VGKDFINDKELFYTSIEDYSTMARLSPPLLSTSTCTFADDKDSWRAVSFPHVGSACLP